MNPLIPGFIHALHNIATIVWLGGLFALAFLILPLADRIGDPLARQDFLKQLQQRLFQWVLPAIIILMITGMLMTRASGQVARLFDFTNRYGILLSIKHILYFLMVLIAIGRQRMLRKLWQKPPEKSPDSLRPIPVYVNLILGIGVLILSGILSNL